MGRGVREVIFGMVVGRIVLFFMGLFVFVFLLRGFLFGECI